MHSWMQNNNDLLAHQHAAEWIRMRYWLHVAASFQLSENLLRFLFIPHRLPAAAREPSLGRHNVCQLSLSGCHSVALSAALAHTFALSMHLIDAHVQPLCYKKASCYYFQQPATGLASQSENASCLYALPLLITHQI
jgi:hypothetical protein